MTRRHAILLLASSAAFAFGAFALFHPFSWFSASPPARVASQDLPPQSSDSDAALAPVESSPSTASGGTSVFTGGRHSQTERLDGSLESLGQFPTHPGLHASDTAPPVDAPRGGTPTPVPEPNSLALLALGTFALALRRPKH